MRANYICRALVLLMLCLAMPARAVEPEQPGTQAGDGVQGGEAAKQPGYTDTGKGFDQKAFYKVILNLSRPHAEQQPVVKKKTIDCGCDGPYTDSIVGLQEKTTALQNAAEYHKTTIKSFLDDGSSDSAYFYIYYATYEAMKQIRQVATHTQDLISWIATQKKPTGKLLFDRNVLYNRVLERFSGVAEEYYGICEDLHAIKGKISRDDHKILYDICENAINLLNENGIEPFCAHINIK